MTSSAPPGCSSPGTAADYGSASTSWCARGCGSSGWAPLPERHDRAPDPFATTFAAWLGGDLTARIPGGESGEEVVERYSAVLDEIADSHRGESVLVVSHGGAMCMALSALARNLTLSHPRDLPMPSCGVVAVEADTEGWVARSWAGQPLT